MNKQMKYMSVLVLLLVASFSGCLMKEEVLIKDESIYKSSRESINYTIELYKSGSTIEKLQAQWWGNEMTINNQTFKPEEVFETQYLRYIAIIVPDNYDEKFLEYNWSSKHYYIDDTVIIGDNVPVETIENNSVLMLFIHENSYEEMPRYLNCDIADTYNMIRNLEYIESGTRIHALSCLSRINAGVSSDKPEIYFGNNTVVTILHKEDYEANQS